jgi:hypothetical protein
LNLFFKEKKDLVEKKEKENKKIENNLKDLNFLLLNYLSSQETESKHFKNFF